MNSNIDAGNFVFCVGSLDQSIPRREDGPAHGFLWEKGTGPWMHPMARIHRDLASARADSALPYIEVPSEESFLSAVVIEHDTLVAEALLAYMRPGTSSVLGLGDRRPDDRTLLVGYSNRYPTPCVVLLHDDPRPLNADTLDQASVIQTRAQRMDVRGVPGYSRAWESVRGPSLHQSRLPSLTLNWYVDRTFWTVQSSYLSEAEVLAIAESSVGGPP